MYRFLIFATLLTFSTSKIRWDYSKTQDEFKNDTALQEENIKDTLDTPDPTCVAAFTDGSAPGNPGLAEAGAVIYHDGLEEEPFCISKPDEEG